MKKLIQICLTLSAFIFIVTGCSKKKGCMDPVSINYDSGAEKDDGSCIYGGDGGDVTVAAFPQHHGVPIPSDSLYPDSAWVKFNAINQPGTSPGNYDKIFVGEAGEDHVHITGLKKGKYYIYMTGRDTHGVDSFRVTGGIPYTINQTSGELDVNVPVTE